MSQDFFTAGFVPGAIVYFAYDVPKGKYFCLSRYQSIYEPLLLYFDSLWVFSGGNEAPSAGPFLQEDVMSLQGLEFIAQQAEPAPKPTQEQAIPSPSVVPEEKPTDKKKIKPKWLKM